MTKEQMVSNMRWVFLATGICGAPFTGGWSIVLGVLAFAFAYTSNAVEAKTKRAIRRTRTPVGTIWWALAGSGAILLLLVLFFVLAGIVLIAGGDAWQR